MSLPEMMSPADRKWLDALKPYLPDAVLPYYRSPDGSVDVDKTVKNFVRLVTHPRGTP
jgi:hypothetical protein